MTDVLSYLDSKNIQYERQGNEVLIVCPYCNKQKLSINIQSGVYKCWHCEALNPESPYVRGHISQLQREWGDILEVSSPFPSKTVKKEPDPDFTELAEQQHKEIWNHPDAIKYLFTRGFEEEDIKQFHLGYDEDLGEKWIAIPSFEDNKVTLISYRRFTNNDEKIKKYRREKGGKSPLWNGNILKDNTLGEYNNEVNIAEGQFDGMTLVKHGYKNTVAMTAGAGTLKEEWYDLLLPIQRINLILDPDSVGQGAAENVWAKRLGYNRCWNVLLPEGYDVNKYFLYFNEFDKILKSATQFRIKNVVSLQEAFYEMYNDNRDEKSEDIFPTPWENVNKKLKGGFRRGRLTVLSGLEGTGKTSWAMQVLYHLSSVYKVPTFMFNMEMNAKELSTKVVQLKWDLTTDEVHKSDALIYEQELGDLPIYFGYSSKVTPEIFYNTMVEVRNRYGVELAIFDNFHRMMRTGREYEEGKASGMFKDITMDLGIPFILIAQPRKKNQEQEADRGFMPTRSTIKGTSALAADADDIILLFRRQLKEGEGNTTFESKTKIIFDKSRFSGGGIVTLEYLGEKSRFIEWGKEE